MDGLNEISGAKFKTIFGLITGVLSGLSGEFLGNIDILLGIILKSVSIVSFLIVIIINIPKLIKVIRGNENKKI